MTTWENHYVYNVKLKYSESFQQPNRLEVEYKQNIYCDLTTTQKSYLQKIMIFSFWVAIFKKIKRTKCLKFLFSIYISGFKFFLIMGLYPKNMKFQNVQVIEKCCHLFQLIYDASYPGILTNILLSSTLDHPVSP